MNKSEYAKSGHAYRQAGVDYSVMEPFKMAMVEADDFLARFFARFLRD